MTLMSKAAVLLLLLCPLVCTGRVDADVSCHVPLEAVKPDQIIPGRYVAVFKRGTTAAEAAMATAAATKLCAAQTERGEQSSSTVTSFAIGGGKPGAAKGSSSTPAFRGFVATLSDAVLNELRGCHVAGRDKSSSNMISSLLDYIAPDAIVTTSAPIVEHVATETAPRTQDFSECANQEGSPWGLVRVSQVDKDLNDPFHYDNNPTVEVDVYIIDTGIYLEHEDFGGRAEWGADLTTNDSPKTDQNGHGTHVAGTVGGTTYGFAKYVRLVAVRVLGEDGSGSMSGVIMGLEFTCTDHEEKQNVCVANMSLGGGKYTALNTAVAAVVECGCPVVVAAGNGASDACDGSPSSAEEATTVMASNQNDQRAYYSDYGTCTDMYAPGSSIKSAWIGGSSATATISGTSMASPHVAGAMAALLAHGADVTPAELKEEVISRGSVGMITENEENTPNILLHETCN